MIGTVEAPPALLCFERDSQHTIMEDTRAFGVRVGADEGQRGRRRAKERVVACRCDCCQRECDAGGNVAAAMSCASSDHQYFRVTSIRLSSRSRSMSLLYFRDVAELAS
jgi:hypothetical protein